MKTFFSNINKLLQGWCFGAWPIKLLIPSTALIHVSKAESAVRVHLDFLWNCVIIIADIFNTFIRVMGYFCWLQLPDKLVHACLVWVGTNLLQMVYSKKKSLWKGGPSLLSEGKHLAIANRSTTVLYAEALFGSSFWYMSFPFGKL